MKMCTPKAVVHARVFSYVGNVHTLYTFVLKQELLKTEIANNMGWEITTCITIEGFSQIRLKMQNRVMGSNSRCGLAIPLEHWKVNSRTRP